MLGEWYTVRKIIFYGLFLCVLCLAALQLRQILIEKGVLDGTILEAVVQSVRSGDVTVGDAVAAFCRETILYGSE